ncbi:MAG: CHAT domain-containing protein, partial [Chlorobium sp.]|nr:CHAT domain-containing protein [Chlorobium sp.]
SWGQYDKALKYYDEALAIERKLGHEGPVGVILNNIGAAYYILNQYGKAINSFKESIELEEKLRKTATGTARRDYLASVISAYNFLVSSYLLSNDYTNAFAAMETSRAKLLAERLAGSDTLPAPPSVKLIQQNLPPDTSIISFANTGWSKPSVLIITKDDIVGLELDRKKFMASLPGDYQRSITQLLSKQRGLKLTSKSEEQIKTPQKSATTASFDDVINYYRSMLTDTSFGINRSSGGLTLVDKTRATGKEARLDRLLYDFLLQPLAKHFAGKKRLIIIPDGVLSYLPFETLTDENNTYLVEKYAISYSQSMGIMNALDKRSYPGNRQPMLAFGGAVYDEVSYSGDMITTEKQLLALAKDVNDDTRNKRTLGVAYASIGMGNWNNLPGTLSEVETIAKTVKGTKVVTGRDVTESRVKQMSASGELANYKVIHFATHGIVVPEIPELSAIVLSQLKNQLEGEDGYLRMDKIEGLKLKADFVNLSACETGLGKIFGGEGVVGLTQSFLLAGANGLSASLWSVNDVSTSQFMVALYNIVEQKKIGYSDAITEIKRSFIQGKFGEAYKSPYYWAPFVYYGKL